MTRADHDATVIAMASAEHHSAGWFADRYRSHGVHSSELDSWHDLIDQFDMDYVADLYDVADGDIRIAAAMAGGGRLVLSLNREIYTERHGHRKAKPTTPFAQALADERPSWAKLAHVLGEQAAEHLYEQYDGSDAVLPLFDGTVDYDATGDIVAVHPSYVEGAARTDEIERIRALHSEINERAKGH